MSIHNPLHPGEFIKEVYIEPSGISVRQIAENMQVSPSTLTRLISGNSSVSPEMAFRLSKTLGRTPESWLAMQDSYNLWQIRKNVSLTGLRKIKMPV